MRPGTKSARILELANKHPDWPAKLIAREVDTSDNVVRVILNRGYGARGKTMQAAVNELPVNLYSFAVNEAAKAQVPIHILLARILAEALEKKMKKGAKHGEQL